MPKVLLGDVAREHKEVCRGSKAGFPIVGLEHLLPGDINLEQWSEDSENTFTKMFRKGNILFGRRRAYLKKAAMAPFDGICSGDITVIEAIPDRILPELLPFIIQNDNLFEYAVGKSAGSLSPRVKWEYLKKYEFELPDMDKQKKLAELLWAMDEAKQFYQKLIKATDELVKSQFIALFGNPVTNSMKWPSKALKSIAPETSPDLKKQDEYWILNLDMIETFTGCIIGKVMSTKNNMGPSVSSFDSTMVLYSKLRPYLNKVVVPDDFGYATTELVGLKPDDEILDKYFLFNILRGDDFVAYASRISAGTQMPRMPVKVLREFQCILPPIELQKKFTKFVLQSDKSKFELEQALSELTVTYKRIIAEYLG